MPAKPAHPDYVAARIGLETRARVEHAAAAMGLSLSDWFRMAIMRQLEHHGALGSTPENDGFHAGRLLGLAYGQLQVVRAIGIERAQLVTLEEILQEYPQGISDIQNALVSDGASNVLIPPR